MSTCKGCGKKIIWGMTEDGKVIPLDKVPPVYEVFYGFEMANKLPLIKRKEGHYVTHFATCPKANEFSRAKKKKNNDK